MAFFSTSTHILESVYVPDYTIQGLSTLDIKAIRFLKCCIGKKNNHFAEFKAHLIHWKQVSLLHNTVLILWDEGAGLVAMIMDVLTELFFKFQQNWLWRACLPWNSMYCYNVISVQVNIALG